MLEKKLVITNMKDGLCMASIEDSRVVEIQFHKNSIENVSIGDIYVGRVKNVVPSLNAAFIDITGELPCYYEMKKNAKPIFTHKIGKRSICEAEEVIVQVEKDAIKTKAPTVTSNLNFTGNYVVLTTENNKIGVSAKIKDGNRERLLSILNKYASNEYGFVVRTNARLITEDVISAEIENLIDEYKILVKKAMTRPSYTCLKKANLSYINFIRDMYKGNLKKIITDDAIIYENILDYCKNNLVDIEEKIELYADPSYPLYKQHSLESRLQEAIQKKVWMKSGAYLIIEPTEALTVIDVNSGKCTTKKNQEEQYFKINKEAAIEVAHQLRLRNISGIIIVDFINLKDNEKMQEILKILKECLQNDRIPTKLIDVTKLQLVEITRKKTHKSLMESLK